jgi:hypothetical protein
LGGPRAYRHLAKKPKRVIDSYMSPIRIRNLNLKIVGLKVAEIQSSDGRIDKRKIAIFNIDSILDCIILGLRNQFNSIQ